MLLFPVSLSFQTSSLCCFCTHGTKRATMAPWPHPASPRAYIRVIVPESSGNSQKSLWVDSLKLHTHSPDESCGQSNREHDLLHPLSVPPKLHSHKPGVEGMVERSPWLRVNVRKKKDERARREFDNNKANFTLQLVQPYQSYLNQRQCHWAS